MLRLFKDFNLKKFSIPESIILKKDSVDVNNGVKTIDNVQVFYREALPIADVPKSDISVLLLHGMRFSSKTWLDLGTINLLGAMGYHTVAIDLPGFASTPSAEVENKAEFIHSIFRSFGLSHPVIVSPSMSGWYALPYLVKSPQSLAGYVPVAPVGFEVLEELPSCEDKSIISQVYKPLQEYLYDPIPDLNNIRTPTMVVFGEKDRSRSSALLSLLPLSQCQEIPNGSHPAYLDNPDLWHQLLFNFLYVISEHHTKE